MTMKVGIDIHGVIDKHPEFYSKLSKMFMQAGAEIHIITGLKRDHDADKLLNEAGVEFTHYFSIIDYHESIGTKIEWKNGLPYMDNELWNEAKAQYCEREGIDVMFDDSPTYKNYFDGDCIYMLQHNPDRVNWRDA